MGKQDTFSEEELSKQIVALAGIYDDHVRDKTKGPQNNGPKNNSSTPGGVQRQLYPHQQPGTRAEDYHQGYPGYHNGWDGYSD
jgi:hypothetical protein